MSEVGHNKNAANFKSLYQILEEMGTLYNPSNPAIALSAMQPRIAELETVMEGVSQKNSLYSNAVALRETKMKPLSKLTTRIANSFRSSGASSADVENVESKVKKIRGEGRAKKINPETASDESISTSQMSYDNRTANFADLITFLETQPSYNPNEDELKIPQLKAENLIHKQNNSSVNTASNGLLTARTNRNTSLYSPATGVVLLAPTIKEYIKSVGDAGKPYYKAAVKLKFTNIKKK